MEITKTEGVRVYFPQAEFLEKLGLPKNMLITNVSYGHDGTDGEDPFTIVIFLKSI